MKPSLSLFLALSVSAVFAQGTLNLSQDLVRLGIASTNMAPNQPTADASPLFVAGVNYAAAKKIPSVIADRGAYYFLSAPGGAHIALNAANNMTIDLQGSDLYFTQRNPTGLYVSSSANLTLQNFTMDYQPLPFTQVQIVSVNAAQRQSKYSLLPGWRDPSFLNADFTGVNPPTGVPNAPELYIFRNGRPAPALSRMSPVLPISGTTITIDENPGSQYATNTVLAQIRPGDVAVLVTLNYGGTALEVRSCTGCTLRNIRIYSGSWIVSYSPSMTMERMYQIPKPDTDRLTNGSASLFIGPAAKGVLRLSRIIRGIDDALAFGINAAGIVQSQSGSRSAVIQSSGGDGYLGTVALPNGAAVAFQAADGTSLGSATVVSQTLNTNAPPSFQATFTFDRDLPGNLTGAMMYATDANGGGGNMVLERNAVEEMVFGRAFAVAGLVASTVSGNYARLTVGNGIHLEQGFVPGRLLQPSAVNVTIRNNVINMTNSAPGVDEWLLTWGGIQVNAAQFVTRPPPVTVNTHKNINITSNFIAEPGTSAVWVGNTAKGTVSNNYFLHPNNNPQLDYQFQAYRNDFTQPLVIKPPSTVTATNNTIDQVAYRCRRRGEGGDGARLHPACTGRAGTRGSRPGRRLFDADFGRHEILRDTLPR